MLGMLLIATFSVEQPESMAIPMLLVVYGAGNNELHLSIRTLFAPKAGCAPIRRAGSRIPDMPNVQVVRSPQESLGRSPCHHREYALKADPDHNGSPLRCGWQQRRHSGPLRANSGRPHPETLGMTPH